MMKLVRIVLWSVILNVLVIALLAQPPSNVSVSPSSGAGPTQTFAFTASDPSGHTNLAWIQVIIGSEVSNVGDCALFVSIPSATAYLTNNAGSGYVGSATLGSNTTLQNSQCTLNFAGCVQRPAYLGMLTSRWAFRLGPQMKARRLVARLPR
jgi:hypothetical protein